MGDEHTYRPERSGQRKHSGTDEGLRFYPSPGDSYFHVPPLNIDDRVFRPATGQFGRVVDTAADSSHVRIVWEPAAPSWHLPTDLRKVDHG